MCWWCYWFMFMVEYKVKGITMITLKNYFFIIAFATFVAPMHAMQHLREKVANIVVGIQTDEETDSIFKKEIDRINAIFLQETNTDSYAQVREQYKKDARRLHPDVLISKDDAEIVQLLIARGVKEESYRNKRRDGLLELVKQELEKAKQDIDAPIDKCNADTKLAENARENSKLAYTSREEKHKQYSFLIDLYFVSGLTIGTAASVAGLVKVWRLFKEYSSPNAILLEKMESAADKAVALTLGLEFDRYNPTKDTDALYMQFDVESLLVQLSSDEVRDQVKKAILAFDKTLEVTYEQCAWHYDDMTPEELAKLNPRLVGEMQIRLQAIKEALKLCKTDLQLDRNKPLEFLKTHYKKMIGCGVGGLASWYLFNKFTPINLTPIVPVAGLLGAPAPQ